MTKYWNIIAGCCAGASESKGSRDGIYMGTKIFAHFSTCKKDLLQATHTYKEEFS